MAKDEICETLCPVDRALSVMGDRWTLLIMRELSFGVHRFDEIQAQTGMSSFLLSTRLKTMEKQGLLEKRLYNKRPPRYEYHRTKKGAGLDAVLLMLRSWGMQYGGYRANEESAVKLVHKRTKKVIDAHWRPPSGAKPFTFDDTERTMSKPYTAEREARRTAFFAAKRGE
jgi:DNA-binding HxlR family transcriptional regulator